MGKKELVALLNLSSSCPVMVEWRLLAVPWGCLRFAIVYFPDHSHLLFFFKNTCELFWMRNPCMKFKKLYLNKF